MPQLLGKAKSRHPLKSATESSYNTRRFVLAVVTSSTFRTSANGGTAKPLPAFTSSACFFVYIGTVPSRFVAW